MPDKKPDNGEAEKENINMRAEIRGWIKCIIVGVVLALFLDFFVIANARVPSGSMEETIPVGARIIGFRHSYLFDEPERGDIVIFKYPDDESIHYVKRIIGLPGETVMIEDGEVYIDGTVLEEPYLDTVTLGYYGPYTVPEGSYFMMGDNRNDSKDSRFWDNTYVAKKKIVAKVLLMYYPSLKTLK